MDAVSTIIPTFNRCHLVGRAIRSVLAQTRPADEVIVVDDGSSDGTADWVEETFAGVVVVRGPHRGVSAARNRGLEHARGDWLAFLDSDDEWRSEKLEAQLAALAADGEHRFCHCDELWVRRGRRVNPRRRHRKHGGWIFQRCLPLCLISPSAAIIHRSVLEQVGRFDETLPACEDYDLWLRVTARFPVLFVDRPLVVKHGGHEDQLSRTVPALDRFRIRALVALLASEALGEDDRRAAIATLHEKIEVYGRGAIRRGRPDEAAALARWRQRYPVQTRAAAER